MTPLVMKKTKENTWKASSTCYLFVVLKPFYDIAYTKNTEKKIIRNKKEEEDKHKVNDDVYLSWTSKDLHFLPALFDLLRVTEASIFPIRDFQYDSEPVVWSGRYLFVFNFYLFIFLYSS